MELLMVKVTYEEEYEECEAYMIIPEEINGVLFRTLTIGGFSCDEMPVDLTDEISGDLSVYRLNKDEISPTKLLELLRESDAELFENLFSVLENEYAKKINQEKVNELVEKYKVDLDRSISIRTSISDSICNFDEELVPIVIQIADYERVSQLLKENNVDFH